jgi:hypothetical protein
MTVIGELCRTCGTAIFERAAYPAFILVLLVGLVAAGLPGLVTAQAEMVADRERSRAVEDGLCLDGFCIGQPITDDRFNKVEWLIPQNFIKKQCNGVGCQPTIAFRGYEKNDQAELANALSWVYSTILDYNVITMGNLSILRTYKHECNPSARGIWGERRFIGIYRSAPNQYVTIVGLRLIGGELRIYRIVRQYPYHNPSELRSLATQLYTKYGQHILLYDYLSSNAYADVISQAKDGWFGRSTMFNPNDLSDNAAELVLIDPNTRSLLQPSSMPESGEIKPLPVRLPNECSRTLPIQ